MHEFCYQLIRVEASGSRDQGVRSGLPPPPSSPASSQLGLWDWRQGVRLSGAVRCRHLHEFRRSRLEVAELQTFVRLDEVRTGRSFAKPTRPRPVRADEHHEQIARIHSYFSADRSGSQEVKVPGDVIRQRRRSGLSRPRYLETIQHGAPPGSAARRRSAGSPAPGARPPPKELIGVGRQDTLRGTALVAIGARIQG